MDDYLRAKSLARGTRNEYFSTLRKWEQWGGGVGHRAALPGGYQYRAGRPRPGARGFRLRPALASVSGLSTYYLGSASQPPGLRVPLGNSNLADAATPFDVNGTGTTP